uniref:Predicted protein n=1 Tax=Hordeum vulgare subsp. vulgare TaxID=112509 RepID=F2ECN8_HORVV|nr:predicted protein [Hordeum vulgare subsp. vulgare]
MYTVVTSPQHPLVFFARTRGLLVKKTDPARLITPLYKEKYRVTAPQPLYTPQY